MDAQQVRTLLDYDPETGIFRWRVQISKHPPGSVAGTRNSKKRYVEIRYGGKYYSAHRLAFLWMEGRWPVAQVDHANLDRFDNRWSNLREATVSQNAANRRVSKLNKLGLKGVIRVTRCGVTKYEARIRVHGKQLHLGRFNSPQEAHQAYVKAAEQHFGGFARTH